MAKRAVKTIQCSYNEAEKENGLIDSFLNSKETGEIYGINTDALSNNITVFYTFFYERLENEEIESDTKQRKISENKKSKIKPKLL